MTFETDFKIIKNLTEIQACSGNEGIVRQYIREIIKSYCDLNPNVHSHFQ